MRAITKATDAVGVIAVIVLMLLVSADVLGRYLLNRPIWGTMETSQILMAMMVFFSWPGIQASRAHVNSDMLTSRFSARGQAAANILSTFSTLVLFALMAWQAYEIANKYFAMGRLVYVVEWPLAPFYLLLALAAVITCLVLVYQLTQALGKVEGGS